jgi:hypothetical protein
LKGRKTEGDFIRLSKFVALSPQFLGLSPRANKAFTLIAIRYNGKNNGNISVPRKDLTFLGFGANGDAFASGINELIAKGFVVLTRPGGYRTGCSLYAITTEPLDACPGKHDFPDEHAPRHDWRKKAPCTESVQHQSRIPCLQPDTGQRNCTETVLVEATNDVSPSTETVHLYRSTKRSGLSGVAPGSAFGSTHGSGHEAAPQAGA